MIGLVVPIAKKMSESGAEPDPEEIMQTVEIVGLDQRVAQILKKCGCQPRSSVSNELLEVENELLTDTCVLLFNQAKVRYEEQLTQFNITDQVKIEQKRRRKLELIVADTIDLYIYVIGIRNDFPRQALKDVTLYRDIALIEPNENADDIPDEPKEEDTTRQESSKKKSVRFGGAEVKDGGNKDVVPEGEGSESGVSRNVVERVENGEGEQEQGSNDDENARGESETSSDEHEEIEAESSDEDEEAECSHAKCIDMKHQFQNLWAYVKSMETISNERISTLEKKIQKSSEQTKNRNKSENQSPPKPKTSSEHGEKNEKENKKSNETADDKTPNSRSTPEGQSGSNKKETVKETPKANERSSGSATPRSDQGKKRTGGLFPAANQNQGSKHTPTRTDARNNFPNKSKKKDLRPASMNGPTYRGRKVELYIPNIRKDEDVSLKDICEVVREKGKKGGLFIITSTTVTNRFSKDIVGCRISVPEQQRDDALGSRWLPDGFKCRTWSTEKPNKERSNQGNHRRQYQNSSRWNPDRYQESYGDGGSQGQQNQNRTWVNQNRYQPSRGEERTQYHNQENTEHGNNQQQWRDEEYERSYYWNENDGNYQEDDDHYNGGDDEEGEDYHEDGEDYHEDDYESWEDAYDENGEYIGESRT